MFDKESTSNQLIKDFLNYNFGYQSFLLETIKQVENAHKQLEVALSTLYGIVELSKKIQLKLNEFKEIT